MESSGRSTVERVTSGILPGNGRGNGGKRDGILRETKTAGTVVRKRDGILRQTKTAGTVVGKRAENRIRI